MIINSLWAENVLKYVTLKLDEVPEQGLIAVIGDNESGKSSIGESVCFALFGRTFSLEPGDLDKVIRWGESRCSIKLDFTTPNGQRYQINRFLDELGNHGASISRAGEEPMVRGVDEVQTRLKDLIGFGYTEFIESFYLAQREITTPHPHSYAVKAMAGVDALEKVVVSCQAELEQAREQTEVKEMEKQDVEEQIAAMGLQDGYLDSLESEREVQSNALEENRQQIAAAKHRAEESDRHIGILRQGAASWLSVPLEASFSQRSQQADELQRLAADLEGRRASDPLTAGPYTRLVDFAREAKERLTSFDGLRKRAGAYGGWLERLLGDAETLDAENAEPTFAARQEELFERETRTSSARRTSRVLAFVFLFLAFPLWGMTGLLGLAPDSPQATALSGWLARLSPGFQESVQPWLPVIASVLTLLFLGLMGRGIALSGQIKGLEQSRQALMDDEQAARREASDLAKLDQIPLPEAAGILEKLRDEAIASRVPEFREGQGAALLDSAQHRYIQDRFGEIVAAIDAGISQIKADSGREIERLHETVAKNSSEIARLKEVIAQERERVRRYQELTAIAGSLQDKIDRLLQQARVRTLAIELLHGAIHYISQRFNTEVRNLSADSLPKFTNGRYEHLQIDENLKVKAFSNEKRDFMELDEISSGTQRQIMLAVRLSLSQKLVNSVIQGPQMLFLDEPFAFFDERRTASALNVLPRVSGDFTQIWVTSQTFPEESRFDLYVECDAEETRSPLVRRGS